MADTRWSCKPFYVGLCTKSRNEPHAGELDGASWVEGGKWTKETA